MGIIGISHRKIHFWSLITNFFPVLNTIDTNLDAKNIATILRYCEAKVFFVDYEYVKKAMKAVELLMVENTTQMSMVVMIKDVDSPNGIRLGELEYKELVSALWQSSGKSTTYLQLERNW
nr:butyrate--CoA ligase AAE11, peroxisomal-like [Ipomoea trifida]